MPVITMILIKSLVGGVVGVFAYAALIALVVWLRAPNESVGAIALPGWMVMIGAILCFFAGFYWTFRRRS